MNSAKLGRNEKCWCGSGKKYKNCHLGRENEEADNIWDSVGQLTKAFSQKECMSPDCLKMDCEGAIISAHTVPRGSSLKKIATNSHVLGLKPDMADLQKTNGKIRFKKLGVRQASTFNGFCAKHDREFFSCVENEDFVARPDQCLAVCFRAVSRELYAKRASSVVDDILVGADKGKSQEEQIMMNMLRRNFGAGTQSAIRELEHAHKLIGDAFATGQTHKVRSYVLLFAETLPMMFSGGFSPSKDITGVQLQDLSNLGKDAEQLFLSAFGTESGSAMVCSWIERKYAIGKTIAEQVCKLPVDQQANWIAETAFLRMENIFLSPRWYSAIDDKVKKRIDRLVMSGVNPFNIIDHLMEPLPSGETDFGFPKVESTFFV
ncbi:SEC-C domain-containing protein [Phaeobacter italicus]|uniref:SEC-C metal-binding domain-containing protein n=1 Tax=Phaeobacter italicus TaxID=481446 RepID=UPI001AD9CB51|nr:SEC-C domain-containing protein [Phaeobacter italicus]MBO9441689.1 SEC-C domain-containing protein [Phaeobacter italicus]